MPNIPVQAAAEGLPKFARRKALGLMAAATIPVSSVAAAPADADDAELLALGEEFDRLYPRYLVAQDRGNEAVAVCEAKLKASGVAIATDTWWSTRNAECDAAINEWNELGEAVDVVAKKIREAKALTAAGLLVKAKILPFDLSLRVDHSEPRNDWNWDVECLQLFIEQMERFVGGRVA